MLVIAPGALRLPLGPSPGPAGHPPLGEGFFTQSPKRSNTSTMANYREEHIRNNRRLARQVVGAAALLLALIGLFTVLGWIVGLVRAALDDTDLRNEYRDRLYGMVMLDPVAFDDVNSVDEGIFKQAAIWGTVYQVQNSGGSLDQYERDPDTGSALIPALEIDAYISNLLGPDYQVTEGTFSTAEFVYQYDEAAVTELSVSFGEELAALCGPAFGVNNQFLLSEDHQEGRPAHRDCRLCADVVEQRHR